MHLKAQRYSKPLALLAVLALWGGPLSAVETSASAHATQIMATLSTADQAWIMQQARAAMAKASSDRDTARALVNAHFESFVARRIEAAKARALKANDDALVKSVEGLVLPSFEALSFVVLTQTAKQANDELRMVVDTIKQNNETEAALRAMLAALRESPDPSLRDLLDSERCLLTLETRLQAKTEETQQRADAAAADASQSYARIVKVIEQIIATLKG